MHKAEKSRRARIAIAALALLAAIALAASALSPAGAEPAWAASGAPSVNVTRAASGKLVAKAGSTYKLAAKASSGKLSYKSSKPKVASVSKKGVIKAKKAGKAVITVTAKVGSAKAVKKVKVTVVKASKFKKVKKLSARITDGSLEVGQTAKVSLTFSPKKASNKNVAFKSSAPSVASVSATGIVTAKNAGTAKITAISCDNGKAKSTVTVTVSSAAGGSTPPVPGGSGGSGSGPHNQGDSDNPVDNEGSGQGLGDTGLDMGFLAQLVDEGVVEAVTDEDGRLESICGKFTDARVESAEDAADVLNSSAALFGKGFKANASEISFQSPATDDDRSTYYRYSPEIDGIPVEGSQVVMAVSEGGEVQALSSSYNDAINQVDTAATLTAEEAEAQAGSSVRSEMLAGLGVELGDDGPRVAADAKLVILANRELGRPALVYRVDVSTLEAAGGIEDYSDEAPASEGEGQTMTAPDDPGAPDPDGEDAEYLPRIERTYYLYANDSVGHAGDAMLVVDALEDAESDEGALAAGEVRAGGTSYLWESLIMMGYKDLLGKKRTFGAQHLNWNMYRFRDPVRSIETYKLGSVSYSTANGGEERMPALPGFILALPISSVPNATAVSLQSNMSEVYDYYLRVLHRRSFDGAGATIKMTYGDGDYRNAYWSGKYRQFEFGSARPYAAALDIVGHEFTHAVISHVVGRKDGSDTLEYSGESGALNESLADIMGSLVEGKDRAGSGRWTIGEDTGEPSRWMNDPSGYPVSDSWKNKFGMDSYPASYSERYTGSEDNHGVHVNSGIFNLAAYKMMTDSRTSGIDDGTWAKAFYYSLYLLTTDATFGQARSSVVFFAKSHPSSFGDSQVRAIEDAFDAVGITASFESGGSGGGENEGWQDESALPQDDDIANGTFGTCPWRISADGRLVIGPGELPSNDRGSYDFWPWYSSREIIKSVKFNSGVSLSGRASSIFGGCSSLASVDALSGWDTSAVTDMSSMFYNCKSLSSVDALSGWDTSKVTDMWQMFNCCESLESVDALSGWDTSGVTDMGCMFYGCRSLASVDALSGWDTSKVADMGYMFYCCESLESVDALSGWDMSHVRSLYRMFCCCYSLASVDALSGWDTSSVTDMGQVFSSCKLISSVDALSGWDTSSVKNMEEVFEYCYSLASVDALSRWDTSSVTDMTGMFWDCSSLSSVEPLSGWDTSAVTKMGRMFSSCSSLSSVDALSGWDTSGVTEMFYMFSSCSSLSSVDALSGWDVSHVTKMNSMFYNCKSLSSVDALSGWDTSSVTTTKEMFAQCSSLSVEALSAWDMSSVSEANMWHMFFRCRGPYPTWYA